MEHDQQDDSDPRPADETPQQGGDAESQRTNPKWTSERYPLVDADFVGKTLDRVMHDRSEISEEASRVDEVSFSWEVLDTFRIPDPSPDFVDSTLRRVMAARTAGFRITCDNESEFHELIQAYQVPSPTKDFVETTLRAVRRTPRILPATQSRARRPIRTLAASVAALVLCSVAIYWPGESEPLIPPVAAEPVSASWAAKLHNPNDKMNFRVDDPITHWLRKVQSKKDGRGR